MLSLFVQIVCGTVIAFNPWFEFYLVLRFFLGFVSVSIVFSAFVLCETLLKYHLNILNDYSTNAIIK